MASVIIGFGVSYATGRYIGQTKTEEEVMGPSCPVCLDITRGDITWKKYGFPLQFRLELISAQIYIDMPTNTYSTNKFLLNSAIWSIIIFGGTSGILLLLDKNKRK